VPTPLSDEYGTIRKKWTGRLPIALLYPNLYPVAVSNLGFQLVYGALNAQDGVVCERFVYPARRTPFRSLESSRPLTDFPLVFASVSFEHDYPRLVAMLAAGAVPPLSADRGMDIQPGMPLVLFGGVAMFINPEPLAAFADLIAIGEAEAILPSLLALLTNWSAYSRRDLCHQAAASVPGCYAPALYRYEHDKNGVLTRISAEEGLPGRVRKVVATAVENAPVGHSLLYSPKAELNMHMVELGRGCSRACRFCAAGYVYRPPRLWPPEAVGQALQERPPEVERIGLLGMEMSPDPHLVHLAETLLAKGCLLSFSSLRADRLSPQLLEVLGKSELKSAAIAADGASERLRRIMNKGISAQDLHNAAVSLVEAGIFHLKIYLMIGLPGEDETDLAEFAELIRSIRAAILPLGRARGRVSELTLSLNCFVPKPWTPFQYCAFAGGDSDHLGSSSSVVRKPNEHIRLALASLQDKNRLLRRLLKGEANLHFTFDSPEQALEQAVYARADRRIAPVLLARGANALSFRMAMRRYLDQGQVGSAIWNYALRPRQPNEVFCWDVIDHGFAPGYMWREYERAMRGLATLSCEPERCRSCGVCHAEIES